MKRANRVVAVLGAFLAVHLAVVVGLELRDSGRNEVFPLFNWDLFSSVPNPVRHDFTIRLLEVNGRVLARPVVFADAGRFVSTSRSPDAPEVFRRLGTAIHNGDEDAAASARDLVEGRFLGQLQSARYEVVRVTYDVIERIECRCFIDVFVLAELEKR